MARLSLRRSLIGIAALLLLAAGAAVLYFVNPSEEGLIPCAFYQMTGFYCAGCGTARAFHALLHGDLAAALSFNGLSLLALPPLTLLLVWSLFGGRLPGQRFWVVAGSIVIALGVVFTLLRNIPLPQFAFLRP